VGALQTLSLDFRPIRATNATDNGYPTRNPTATEPEGTGNNAAQASASGVFDLVGNGVASDKNRVILVPYGAGADTNTFSMRVIGWRRTRPRTGNEPDKLLWVPVPLADFACTLSVQTGVAGKALVATDLFCDTIALTGTTANDDIDVSITSPGNNLTAHVVVDLKGFQKLEVTFTTGGSATSCNALAAWY
jgi:hypothetical protein